MKQYLATLIEGKELSREDTHEIMVNIILTGIEHPDTPISELLDSVKR